MLNGATTNTKDRRIDPLPEKFSNYEEAAEFWDAHDTTDYVDVFQPVTVEAEFRKRHYEVEIDKDVLFALRERARRTGVPVSRLASDMLRRQIAAAA